MLKKDSKQIEKNPKRHKFKNNKVSKYYGRRVRIEERKCTMVTEISSLMAKRVLKAKEKKKLLLNKSIILQKKVDVVYI
jgi:hypothetical protein